MSGQCFAPFFMGQLGDDECAQNSPAGVVPVCPCVLARVSGGKNWNRKEIRIMLTTVSLFTQGY
ncbi:MAG: hypothetical protein HZB82_08565 [Deltaproteobacteria bacterium]|nr:hypothetical protein [Deltaproteobacteria bacterium]